GIRRVAFSIEETEWDSSGSSLAGPVQEGRFRAFLRRFFARMRREPEAIVLREWERAVAVIGARGTAPYGQETEPLRILSVGVAGDVGSFSPEFLGMRDARYGDFTFGNVVTDDIETITSRILASWLARDFRAALAPCERSCAWFRYRAGGAPPQ